MNRIDLKLKRKEMKKNKYSESGGQHTFVLYVFIPIFSVIMLNIYLFNNLFFSIISVLLILTIYHFLIGYRFYKNISFSKDSMILSYPYSIQNKNESIFLYENISKIKVVWGAASNPSFIKFYISKNKIKFVSPQWDIKDIIFIVKEHCNKDTFDFNACEIINEQEKLKQE